MERVVRTLIERGETISTMESCTGGGLANAITNIPDASKVIKFSAVTYSNEYKEKMGVNSQAIDRYTVYSSEVAEEMAKKVSMFAGSTYGVGITGKLKKADENNKNTGSDDVVFLSIYDSVNDEYYDSEIEVHYDTRSENKQEIIDIFIEKFLEIVKNKTK
jgi:PncC family amidohydrolase